MKPIEVAIENGLKLREFENLKKAEEFFLPLIEQYGNELKKLFFDVFNTDLQYSFTFLDIFDKIVRECISGKKYESTGLTLEKFDRALGVYFGDLAVKTRFGKWVVKEDGFVKNRFNLGIEEANGYCYHMGLSLTSSDYNPNDNKAVILKIFTEKFHLPKIFKSKYLEEHLVNSINNFNDKRYSEANPTITISSQEIDNFKRFDIIPHLYDIEVLLQEEKKPNTRDEVYHYLQYYCWKTQNRVVCQFLIDRLKFEESIPIRKQFFWSRLDMIENLASYDISVLLRIANDNTDKNFKNCQDLLKKNKINYH
ncbi:MAG TPA: hypothetical protein DIW47_10345 [Bacteroidetes bacterium]|nr:hypothetical protein [Bacteroidota bacterium]